MKICSKCKIEKDESEFDKSWRGKDRLRADCKTCKRASARRWQDAHRDRCNGYARKKNRENPLPNRARARKWRMENRERFNAGARRRHGRDKERHLAMVRQRKYGISPSAMQVMLEKQGFSCAICGKPNGTDAHRDKLQVDHDHTTNKVRALLCGNCNKVLGYVKDDPRILLKAAYYLIDHQEAKDATLSKSILRSKPNVRSRKTTQSVSKSPQGQIPLLEIKNPTIQ